MYLLIYRNRNLQPLFSSILFCSQWQRRDDHWGSPLAIKKYWVYSYAFILFQFTLLINQDLIGYEITSF